MVGLEVSWEPIEALYLGEEGVMPDLPLLASREPVPVYDLASGRQIGRATTRAWSTLLKKYIVLATVEAPWSAPGTEIGLEMTVRYRRRAAPARVVRTPFFWPQRARLWPAGVCTTCAGRCGRTSRPCRSAAPSPR